MTRRVARLYRARCSLRVKHVVFCSRAWAGAQLSEWCGEARGPQKRLQVDSVRMRKCDDASMPMRSPLFGEQLGDGPCLRDCAAAVLSVAVVALPPFIRWLESQPLPHVRMNGEECKLVMHRRVAQTSIGCSVLLIGDRPQQILCLRTRLPKSAPDGSPERAPLSALLSGGKS